MIMSKLIFLLIAVLGNTGIVAQSTFINLEKFRLKGYIFEEKYKPADFKIENITGRFTPVLLDIEKAEQLVSIFFLHGCKLHKQQRRQYLGYKKGEIKYLLVHIMLHESEKQFSRDFTDWGSEMSFWLSEPGGKQKSFLYLINLTDNTIGYY